ncbi:uncharacterized protein LOC136085642 [Hydra vulgaris]|uniref:Uncharacterized protein LOC136085642 n=1 Tax=Hydra vulgaris TaxID=6087 RepID=A0ABM4CMK6_HYDVU
MKKKFSTRTHSFQFHQITPDDTTKIMLNYVIKKTSMLKSYIVHLRDSLTDCINNSIDDCKFSSFLKMADVIPCIKKNDPTDKSNYYPISILPAFTKVFETILYEQILIFIERRFDKLLCGFRRGYSTQHAFFCYLISGIIVLIMKVLLDQY